VNNYPVAEPEYMATQLEQNKSYEFRVRAVNKAGSGEPSDPTPSVTPKDPDGKIFRLGDNVWEVI